MKAIRRRAAVCAWACVLLLPAGARGQADDPNAPDRWVTVEGVAAGTGTKAHDQALARALRTAVEQACGVFLNARSKTEDYQAVYDKIFAGTVGYVREHRVLGVSRDGGNTTVRVRARVSTRKFQEDWVAVAHTIEQEGNPRVIIAIAEAVHHGPGAPDYTAETAGIVQSKIEDFFLDKGVRLMDRRTADAVVKREVMLAVVKNDDKAVAALGARLKADVVVTGRATATFGRRIEVAGQALYQYTSALRVRVIRTDSAGLLVSKAFGPVTSNTLQRVGGGQRALARLAAESAPKLLAAVVEAWRKQVNVRRNVQLIISGMSFQQWKVFRDEVKQLAGVEVLRLRDITEDVATIDAECRDTAAVLAEDLAELKNTRLDVTGITANRIKLAVRK